MLPDEIEDQRIAEERPDDTDQEELVPVGIARIRDEWRAAGLAEQKTVPSTEDEIEPVVFSEIDGGAGIGDYVLDCETVKNELALSQEGIDRLISSGEIDSILVRGADSEPRRMISESSVDRFRVDSAIDPDAIKHAAKAMADKGVADAIGELQAEIEELRNTQGKVLQQMKDMLLLEVRNLKEQDRDLTSFVYELAEEIRSVFGNKKRR